MLSAPIKALPRMIDPNSILNDPRMTPITTHDGRLLVTDNRGDQLDAFIIARSSLPVRYASTMFGKTRTWLRTPPRYIKGRKR